MGETITYDDLLEELAIAVKGGYEDITPEDIPVYEVAKRSGVKYDTLIRRIARGDIPAGYEVVERRGIKGNVTKCYHKINRSG